MQGNELLSDDSITILMPSLPNDYMAFYGDAIDVLMGCNTLPEAIGRLKELIEQHEN